MVIRLDENYNAMTSTALLGYVGETNARPVSVEGLTVDGADRYVLTIDYGDGVQYEVDITGGQWTPTADILRSAQTVSCQICAKKLSGQEYILLKKSRIFRLRIGASIGDTAIPSPDVAMDALDRIDAIGRQAHADMQTAVTAAETATTAANNATKSATAAEKSADTATQAAERAETAQTSAETSATHADTARQGAETARQQAVTAQNAAKISADQASASAQQAEADKVITAGYAKTAKENADSTASDRQAVQTLAEQVTADKATVADSATKVAEDRTAAETAAQTAQAVADSLPDDYVTAVGKIAENTAEINNTNTEISELKEDLADLDSQLSESIVDILDGYIPMPIINGQYVHTDGGIYNDQRWSRTDYIDCSNLERLIFVNNPVATIYNAFYDADKNFVSTFRLAVGSTTIVVPSNARYFALSNTSADMREIKLVSELTTTIETINGKADALTKAMFFDEPLSLCVEPYAMTQVYLHGGSKGTFKGWFNTNNIDVSEYRGNKVRVKSCSYGMKGETPNIPSVVWLDVNKQYISDIESNTTDSRHYEEFDVVIPQNAHYAVLTSFMISDDEKPAYLQLVKQSDAKIKVLCIGDSLTEGDYGSDPAGTKNVKEKNYPYFMQKHTGFEVVNKGKCGYDSIMYWNSVVKGIDIESLKPDIVVIMLGTNGSMTDTLETDVEPYTSYNNYANTGTGDYCKIIEYVNEQTDGNTQIILCTCPFVDKTKRANNFNNVTNANVVIPKIANRYNLPVVDVYKELGVSAINTNVFQPIDGLHFGEIGYSRLGTLIGSRVKSLCSFVFPSDTKNLNYLKR